MGPCCWRATTTLPEGESCLPELPVCLLIPHIYFCWIVLLASVQADSPCPQEASSVWLKGGRSLHSPPTFPPTSPSPGETGPPGSPLASQPVPLQFSWPGVSFCRPNSSSFKTLSSDNSFFRSLPCSLGWASQGCL